MKPRIYKRGRWWWCHSEDTCAVGKTAALAYEEWVELGGLT